MQAEAASAERSNVVAALKNAAAATGSDFHYLLGTAMRESSLKPDARSTSSSATGLFQFVDQTWLGLVKTHGAQHGLGAYADAISRDASGHYHADAGEKGSILALRNDPQLSALMAGEYAKSTGEQLRSALGRNVCGGELYAAHFLGADAACKLIKLAGSDPSASAAAQFPQAAGANRSVFFNPDGSARSVRQVYDWALKQPGGADTIRSTPELTLPVTIPDLSSARVTAAKAGEGDIQMLLSSVMNWQPSHPAFSSLFGGDTTQGGSPLSFGPGLLSLFAETGSEPS